MQHIVDKWARVLVVPIVSLALVVQPTATFAANAYSLSVVARLGSGDQGLPAFFADPDEVSPIVVRDAAWRLADAYPAERYEVDALVDSLDYEPERAFSFLRDSVKFDPYRGVLRGSRGALGAHAGNALDRSLLLKEILDTMGFESRLVFGTLSDDVARRLLTASIGTPEATDLAPLSSAQLAVAHAANRAYDWLVAAVGDAEIGEAVPTATIGDVKAHVWVQVKEGVEWLDMDTSFPDAKPGSRYAEPERYATEAPASEFVAMNFMVIAETLTSGQLTEDVILDLQLSAAEAEASKVFLYFEPFGAGQGGALADALGPDTRFQPVFQVGEARTAGMPIPGVMPTPEQMTEAKRFIYGSDNAVTSALYLAVEVTGPDGITNRERRVLFDRVPSAARIGGDVNVEELLDVRKHEGTPVAFLEFHQILVSTGGSNPRRVWNDAGYAAWLPERLKEMGEEEMTTEQFLWQLGMFQAVYPAISEEFAIPPLNDLPDARFFVGAPRVFVMSMAALQQGDEILNEQSIDLLLDEIQVVFAGAAHKQLAQRKRWYGVLQSALETNAISSMAAASGYDPASVTSAFNDVGADSVVLTSAEGLDESVNYPARLIADLRAGNVVIYGANDRQVIDTWWTVSPRDGATKAMLDPGLGGGRYGGSGGSGTIGGNPNKAGDYTLGEGYTSTQTKRLKPSKQPPQNCKGGGTEYINVLCNISIRQINPVLLVAIGIAVLSFVAILILRQITVARIEQGQSQGQTSK